MVIVICGLIASGKSTVARALVQLFQRQGTEAAVIDLDLVYDMLQPDDEPKASVATWRLARRAAAGLTDFLLRDGIGVVVVEGDFLSSEHRTEFVTALRSADVPLFVTIRVPVDIALERVRRDPTRGLSRDPDFLRRHYDELGGTVGSRPETDLVVDASSMGIEETACTIEQWASAAQTSLS